MAEVAIPIAVLGVMYIISNKDNERKKKKLLQIILLHDLELRIIQQIKRKTF